MKEIILNVKLYFNQYLENYKKQLLVIFMLLLISLSVSILLPIIVSYFIDNLNVQMEAEYFNILPIGYLTLVLLKIVVEIIYTYMSEILGWTISNNLRENLVQHCINLDFSFHSDHKTGEMIERVDGDVLFLSNFFSEFLVTIMGNTIFVISIIIIFYVQNGIIGLGYSLIAILAYCAILLMQNKIMKLWSNYREDEAQLYGYIQESVIAKDDIIGVGEVKYLKNKLKNILLKIKSDYRKAIVISNIPTSSFFGLLNIGDFVAVGIGVFLFYKGTLSLGSVYLISNYVGLLNRPFIALRYEFDNLQKVGASLNRITELFSLKSSIINGIKKLNSGGISINVNNITFKYENTQVPVLKNISIKVNKGEKVGIVGRTGSGKSTLIRLISRMYEVNDGEILLNDINIREIDEKSLYQNICFITQNSRLFSGTIYDNVACFDSSVSKEVVIEVLRKVGLLKWIDSLPKGIDTVLEKNLLSSGQEQLLYISRAFLKNANLYIFDEINSKLDAETEDKIFKALKLLVHNKTVIFIAHKLRILELVDKVLVLENGTIKAFDNRNEIPNEIIERNLEV